MAFSAGQLENIANSALDFYLTRGDTFKQSLQARPFFHFLDKAGGKNVPSGKGEIIIPVQFAFGDGSGNDAVKGYTHDDAVDFHTPLNVKQAKYAWREHHIGIEVTHTQLKMDGITVSDEMGSTSEHAGRDATVLVNMFENMLFNFGENYARSMNLLAWGDGAGDAKAMAGLRSLLTANPTTGTAGGIDRSVVANKLWRNRARTAAYAGAVTGDSTLAGHGGGAVTVNVANGGALWQVLQQEKRQLTRYGGNPTKFYAGSDFIGGLELEMRSNGYYRQSGFKGSQDGAMGPMLFDGVTVEYDPTLDDLGLTKRGYWYDPRHVYMARMTNEWRRVHKPARPSNKFVLYRSITSTGQLAAQQLNSALVIDIA